MEYKPLYYHLFNALTDAIELLENGDAAGAKQILMDAQIKTEEMYLDVEEKD